VAATVIDQLVVELGLDVSKFTRGQSQALGQLRQFQQQAHQTGHGIMAGPMGQVHTVFTGLTNPIQLVHQGLINIGNQALKTGATVGGAAGVMSYGLAGVAAGALAALAALKAVQEIIREVDKSSKEAQATGYISKWTGTSPEYMSRFAMAAFEKTGAPPEQTQEALYGLQQSIHAFIDPTSTSAGTRTGPLAALAKHGINWVPDRSKSEQQNLQELLTKISETMAKSKPEDAQVFGQQLGIPRLLTEFMQGGAVAMNAAMQHAKLVETTKEETEAAMRLQTAEREVSAETDKLARILMEAVSSALEGFLSLLGYIEKKLIELGLMSSKGAGDESDEGFKSGLQAPKGSHWEVDPSGHYRTAPGDEPEFEGGTKFLGMTFGGHPPAGWYLDNDNGTLGAPRLVKRVPQFSGTGTGGGASNLDTTGTGVGHVSSKAERIAFIRAYAQEKGLNPDALVATAAGEGLGGYIGDHGSSFGDFQLHTGGGMGDLAIAAGINVSNPNTWKEQDKFAIDQMAAHRDAGPGWYAGQWHSTLPGTSLAWAAHSFATPVATPEPPPAISTDGGVVAIGDSIARGFQKFGGAPGTGADLDPTNTTVNAAGGRSPETILRYLKNLPTGSLAGKKVVFSTGVSNGPDQVGLVPQQFEELKRLGAADVVVAGVGTKAGMEGGRYYDLNRYNSLIQGYAQKAGDSFLGALPAVVHPSSDYYKSAMRLLGTAQAATTASNTTHNHGDVTGVSGDLNIHLPSGTDPYSVGNTAAAIIESQTRRKVAVGNANTVQE